MNVERRMSNEEIEQNDAEQSEGVVPTEEFGSEEANTEEYTLGTTKEPMGKGSVVMFVILAVAGAGTYFMYARTGPQTASAADPKAQQVISQFMTNRDKNLGTMKKMLQDTETVVKQFLNYPSVKQVPLSGLAGNPFRMMVAKTPEKPHLDEEAAKKKREEERQAARAAANNLLLQSVMSSGARKSCMINNTLYTEGEKVDSFLIEKISSDGVIVRTGIYRFNVPIQR
jgi:hypothetical protein